MCTGDRELGKKKFMKLKDDLFHKGVFSEEPTAVC